jgi:hypothetical protein
VSAQPAEPLPETAWVLLGLDLLGDEHRDFIDEVKARFHYLAAIQGAPFVPWSGLGRAGRGKARQAIVRAGKAAKALRLAVESMPLSAEFELREAGFTISSPGWSNAFMAGLALLEEQGERVASMKWPRGPRADPNTDRLRELKRIFEVVVKAVLARLPHGPAVVRLDDARLDLRRQKGRSDARDRFLSLVGPRLGIDCDLTSNRIGERIDKVVKPASRN